MAMDLLDETLKRLGVESYSDMTDEEKSTYQGWLRQMSADLTVGDVRVHIENMQRAVTIELADEPEYVYSKILPFLKRPNPKNVHLKARLKNYLLLSAFLATPEQARDALQKNLQQLKAV
jgi:hypothetical protein